MHIYRRIYINIYIKILLIKEYKERYQKYLSLHKDNKEIVCILQTIELLYNNFPEKLEFSVDELELFFFTNIVIKPSEVELYKAIFTDLKGITLSDEIIRDSLLTLKQKAIAEELARTSFEVVTGQRSIDDIRRVYEQFDNIQVDERINPEDLFITDDLEVLYNETIKSPGLRWRLNTLNRMLGSLRKGDFGFIFARPETGKTTFLASEVSFFSTQTSGAILWFNNEEQGNKVIIRCYQAALGLQHHELMSDRTGNQQKYREVTGGNIQIFDSASIHKSRVEELCRQFTPALVLFDQIDKLKGFNDDREDLRLGQIYIWAREIAKQYCPVIGICQAAGTAEGKKWLNMDDVSNAKTSKQAEADFIIGIGKSHDSDLEYVRHLSICKNKLTGDMDTLPELRHGKADVIIQPEIARYRDCM